MKKREFLEQLRGKTPHISWVLICDYCGVKKFLAGRGTARRGYGGIEMWKVDELGMRHVCGKCLGEQKGKFSTYSSA